MSLYAALRPAIFLLPPEQAHRAAILALQSDLTPASHFSHPSLATRVAGMEFVNPLGLAAGFDKNAECFAGAHRIGFGHIEIGTVTPQPQPGNPQPRLFRVKEKKAVINRLGFNNEGVVAAARRLAAHKNTGIIGGNIGKNKDTLKAVTDYRSAIHTLYPFVDYITANISSPNTPGLRALQSQEELAGLIDALYDERDKLIAIGLPHRPIFIKIAPDCDDALLEAIAETALAKKLEGLVVSNTTITRDLIEGCTHAKETGGLSGAPLFARSTEVLQKMYGYTKGAIPLIGVGGVASAEDAYTKIRAGASLVQLYTAMIYQGFGIAEAINRGLAELLARDGFATVADAVGTKA